MVVVVVDGVDVVVLGLALVEVVVGGRAIEAVADNAVIRAPSTSVLTRDPEAGAGSGSALAPRTAAATKPTATSSVIQSREVMRFGDP